VEEPSRRNSLFIEYKNTSEVERSAAELAMREKIIKMVVGFVSLSISTFMFKQIFVNYRHTIFEDIYGRGIVFFICSLIHYLV